MILKNCYKIRPKSILRITPVLLYFAFVHFTFAQQTLDLRNPTIINSGNSLEVGTQYKFSNVTTINNGIAVDALVTIIGSQACSLLSFDDNTSVLSTGISDFNPIIQLNNNEIVNGSPDGAYIDFLFEFVLNSNNTVAVELDLEVYTYDIDGNGLNLREYVVISGFDSYTTSEPTNLEYFPVGRFEARTNETNEGINDNEAYVARAEFLSETSTFNYRAGILRDSGNGNTERLVGLAFQTITISSPQTFDIDDDNDGVENSLDACPGFDDNLDSDNDGIPDGCDFDSDGDGINDDTEVVNGTDENDPCDPAQSAGYTGFDGNNPIWRAADCDNDGVLNGEEFDNATDPYSISDDTDGDGINDDTEVANGTDRNDPCDPAQSVGYTGFDGNNPIWRAADCDNDGIPNGEEFDNATDPYSISDDTDGDGINDDTEVANGTDRNDPCDPAQSTGYTGFDGNNPIWRAADCDNDGIPNGEEFDNATDPYSISDDTDGDGINDDTEVVNGTDENDPCDPAQSTGYTGFDGNNPIWRAADCDNDGIPNGEEFDNATDPYSISDDTDGDGINDDTEVANGTDRNDPCDPAQSTGYTGFDGNNPIWRAADCDNDGIPNGEEFDNATDPYSISDDTDGDGINDDTEVVNGTDENDPCDPAQSAGYTGFDGNNPIWRAADCDNDGVLNGEEFDNATDPYSISDDTDGDGINDDTEVANGTDRNDPCDPAQSVGYTGFDGNNPIWRAADCDNDGVLNGEEFDNATDPYSISDDTDGDGINDDTEVANGTDRNDPCDPAQSVGYTGFDGNNPIWRAADCDNDGVLNGEEFDNATDPYSISDDTDGDGIDNDTEIANNFDVNNPCDPFQKAGYTGFDGNNPIWRAADCDNDGIPNGEEFDDETDPYSEDIISDPIDNDGDGITDIQEELDGTNPNDACDSRGGTPPLDVNCNKPTIVSDLLVPKTNNGQFLIDNIERFRDNTVKIYNRWGVLVFDAKGYNNSSIVFEGISNGRITLQQSEDLPSGVYFYVIQYNDNNKSESITGYLYINK